ncbi:pectinesterase PPME1-like [Gossypium australe]|uniref:Pectinesterase n=1 Tax=Gossypium australe TaxID=47621 RepID=A0A5B6UVL9_9ROSI|nr:pectinesterase PPME1-like [Gossypium australe]
MQGGGGEFDTTTKAIESVPSGNAKRNTAPRPDGKMVGAQAVALRVFSDRSAFYNCKIIGFQDTLCDDRGNHFFKDYHIRGTVDFIFGSGTSLYLNSKIFVEGDPEMAVITVQARESSSEDTGYSFVHGRITRTAKDVFLGRAWKSSPRVVYSYTEMDEIVHPGGWSSNRQPERAE